MGHLILPPLAPPKTGGGQERRIAGRPQCERKTKSAPHVIGGD